MASNCTQTDSFKVPQQEWNEKSYYQLMQFDGQVLEFSKGDGQPAFYKFQKSAARWSVFEFHSKPPSECVSEQQHQLPKFTNTTLEDVKKSLDDIERLFEQVKDTAQNYKQNEFMRLFPQHGSSIPAVSINKEGKSLAHVAAESLCKDSKYMSWWVIRTANQGAPLNHADKDGYTALDYLHKSGRSETIKGTMAEGIDAKFSQKYAHDPKAYVKVLKDHDYSNLLRLLIALQDTRSEKCSSVIQILRDKNTASFVKECLWLDTDSDRLLFKLVWERCYTPKLVTDLLLELVTLSNVSLLNNALLLLPKESLTSLVHPHNSVINLLIDNASPELIEEFMGTGFANLKDLDGNTIFQLAVKKSKISTISLLLMKGLSFSSLSAEDTEQFLEKIKRKYGSFGKCCLQIFDKEQQHKKYEFIKWLVTREAENIAQDSHFFEYFSNGKNEALFWVVYDAVNDSPSSFSKLFTDRLVRVLCSNKQLNEVINLVKKGIDCDVYIPEKTTTLLGFACLEHNVALFTTLLKHGVDCNRTQNVEGCIEPLIIATENKDTKLVERLCNEGVSKIIDCSVTDIRGNTALMIAAKQFDLDTIEFLITMCDKDILDVVDKEGMTALHYLTSGLNRKEFSMFSAPFISRYCKIISSVLKIGADFEILTPKWKNCFSLMPAKLKVSFAVHWCKTNKIDDPSATQSSKIIRSLIDHSDPDSVHQILEQLLESWGEFEKASFKHIVENNKETIVSLSKRTHKTSLLHFAAKNNNVEAYQILMGVGVECNLKGEQGFTPLCLSSTDEYEGVFELLIKELDYDELVEAEQEVSSSNSRHMMREASAHDILDSRLRLIAKIKDEKLGEDCLSLELPITQESHQGHDSREATVSALRDVSVDVTDHISDSATHYDESRYVEEKIATFDADFMTAKYDDGSEKILDDTAIALTELASEK